MISLFAGILAILQIGGLQLPAPVGLVSDFAHVLSPESVRAMEAIAQDVRAKSRGEMAIVTLPDLKGRDKQQVGVEIIRQWKLGKTGNPGDPTRNAGAVILLVPKETSADGQGHCWVATGAGTEGFVTDADAGDICREATPFFRQRDYSTGLTLVVHRVAERFANEFHFALDSTLASPQRDFGNPDARDAAGSTQRRGGGGISPVVLFVVFLVILSILGRGRGRRGCGGCIPIFLPFGGGGGGGWGGGGGGGGFGGGGFGGFGGGGGTSGGGGGSDW